MNAEETKYVSVATLGLRCCLLQLTDRTISSWEPPTMALRCTTLLLADITDVANILAMCQQVRRSA